MSYYRNYSKVALDIQSIADGCIFKLIKKQYPEDDFVLDDDTIIVLTKVDIRGSNDPGQTDESDDNDDSSSSRWDNGYRSDEYEYVGDSGSDDMDDFIDDRPESELIGESCDEIEDKEYVSEESECENNNDSDSGEETDLDATHENDQESDQENDQGSDQENGMDEDQRTPNKRKDNDNDTDSDDDEIPISPNKKPKISVLKSDSESGSDLDLYTDFDHDSDSNPDSDSNDDDNVQNGDSPIASRPIPSNNYDVVKHENKFAVWLMPKIHGKRICLRYHGRIGMEGFGGSCRRMSKKKFCELIGNKRNRDGFTRLNLLYTNARHLEHRKCESSLEKPVRRLLIHLIDQWFPLGIPEKRHLDRAKQLLKYLKSEISKRKIPALKYSNKFYELIPHQGDNRRRLRFTDVEYCNSKVEYVERMESAIDCFENVSGKRGKNPLDHFIEKWLRIELEVLKPEDSVYKILNRVVENTKHPSQRFRTANIFKVDNMNPEMNGDFSTQITTNHRYLLHFTFASNLPCILREGLLPAPKHIHSASRFLGTGIYFWDAVGNAGLNYRSLNAVYILVCRVALGKTQQLTQQYSQPDVTLAGEVDSIFCEGLQYPESRNAEEDINEAKIYCGKLRECEHSFWNLNDCYNKYVVHHKNQVQVQYILKLERE